MSGEHMMVLAENTSKEKTVQVVQLWTIAKRLFYNNNWIQPPKEGSKDYAHLDKVRKVIDELGGNYPEYIQVQVDAFRFYHKFPLPVMLSTEKAVRRYKNFLSKKKKEYFLLYTIEDKTFKVTNTGKEYSLVQVDSTLSEDSTASYASYICNSLPDINEGNREKIINALEYYFAKLSYKKKMPPDALFRALQKYHSIED